MKGIYLESISLSWHHGHRRPKATIQKGGCSLQRRSLPWSLHSSTPEGGKQHTLFSRISPIAAINVYKRCCTRYKTKEKDRNLIYQWFYAVIRDRIIPYKITLTLEVQMSWDVLSPEQEEMRIPETKKKKKVRRKEGRKEDGMIHNWLYLVRVWYSKKNWKCNKTTTTTTAAAASSKQQAAAWAAWENSNLSMNWILLIHSSLLFLSLYRQYERRNAFIKSSSVSSS